MTSEDWQFGNYAFVSMTIKECILDYCFKYHETGCLNILFQSWSQQPPSLRHSIRKLKIFKSTCKNVEKTAAPPRKDFPEFSPVLGGAVRGPLKENPRQVVFVSQCHSVEHDGKGSWLGKPWPSGQLSVTRSNVSFIHPTTNIHEVPTTCHVLLWTRIQLGTEQTSQELLKRAAWVGLYKGKGKEMARSVLKGAS